MKFDVQLRVFQTFGRLSGAGRRIVDPVALSAAMNGEVSHYTVILNHRFFVEAGWFERRGRGEYAATDVLVDYTRRLSVDDDRAKAIEVLRAPVRNSWFWRAVEPQIMHGGAPLSEVIVTLMTEAEVAEEHKPQLRNLIEWLRYVGLVRVTDDRVYLAESGDELPAEEPESPEDGTVVPSSPAGETERLPAPPQPVQPHPAQVKVQPPTPGVVIAGQFSFALGVDDLAKLSPEQIKAVYEAVGTLMAVTATR